jgi:hypothetical protein
MADSKHWPPPGASAGSADWPKPGGRAGSADRHKLGKGNAGNQPAQTSGPPSVSDLWSGPASRYRPAVDVVLQLQTLITLGRVSAHGNPMNGSHVDEDTGIAHMWWKWGTHSKWLYSNDVHVLFVRYSQLCVNGDMEMIVPQAMFHMGNDKGHVDRLNLDVDGQNWEFLGKYIQALVLAGRFKPEGLEEVNSFNELLASKYRQEGKPSEAPPPVQELPPAELAVDMNDAMHCVRNTMWKGSKDEMVKFRQLEWFAASLQLLLRCVHKDHPGYSHAGYISVHSLLTYRDVQSRSIDDGWILPDGTPFDGDIIVHVMDHAVKTGMIPLFETSDDAHGNSNALIRVDHLHFDKLIASEEYAIVTLDNMATLCDGHEYMIYQAECPSFGLVIGASIGIHRGIHNLVPPDPENSEEISFQIASKEQVLTSSGAMVNDVYHIRNGEDFGHAKGQIGYVVKIADILRANINVFRTPKGSLVIITGGLSAHHICAVMVWCEFADFQSGDVIPTPFLEDVPSRERDESIKLCTKKLVSDPEGQSSSGGQVTRAMKLECDGYTAGGSLRGYVTPAEAFDNVMRISPTLFDMLGPTDLPNAVAVADPPQGSDRPESGGRHRAEHPGEPPRDPDNPRSRTPRDSSRGDEGKGSGKRSDSAKGSGKRSDSAKGRGKGSGAKGSSHQDQLSSTSHMTGKGKFHEGLARDHPGWLDGMSYRRTEKCKTIASGERCEHFRSKFGCGFAHTDQEMDEAEYVRYSFVKRKITEHNWPWYAYHHANRFKLEGEPTQGPALAQFRAGDHSTNPDDPKWGNRPT